MPVLDTQLNPRSAPFKANARAMQALVDDLDAHLGRGKLLPRDRIAQLLDPGTPIWRSPPLAALGLYDNAAPGAGVVADMYTALQAARCLAYTVARNLDAAGPGGARHLRKDCAALILWTAEQATRVAGDGIQLFDATA